jgi:hypothetical protein
MGGRTDVGPPPTVTGDAFYNPVRLLAGAGQFELGWGSLGRVRLHESQEFRLGEATPRPRRGGRPVR